MSPSHFDQHVPDILDCLAQLSNDEVPTPPKLARAMLDLLPDEVWHDPTLRWCDPFSKSGVFLREIATRLLDGLAEWEPDFVKRREHIFRNMVFGASITQMTGIVARRSVYCSADASSAHSIVRFDDPEGNLTFVPAQHTFDAKQRCTLCGAPEDLERGDSRENHAYSFIHGAYPTKEMASMKFDVIVGNPPFQIGDGGGGGGASATPLYNLFVEQAIDLDARHVVMITPSRWFSGGKGLDHFRNRMLKDRRFVSLVDHPSLYDCFPGVKIRGGVSYWHWDRDYDGPCTVTTKVGDSTIGAPMRRFLGAYDVLVRRNESVEILDKVARFDDGKPEPSVAEHVSARKPFGDIKEPDSTGGIENPVLVYANQHTFHTDRSIITTNADWIDEWKVLLVKAHGTSGREDRTIIGRPVVAAPGTACTETYLVMGVFGSEVEATQFAAYTQTRFFRFLVSLRKLTQNITRDSYSFVPDLPMDRVWTDEELYERYGITDEQASFIGSLIASRDCFEGAGDVE